MSSPKSSRTAINNSWENAVLSGATPRGSPEPWSRDGGVYEVEAVKDSNFPEELLAYLAQNPVAANAKNNKRYVWRHQSEDGKKELIITKSSTMPPATGNSNDIETRISTRNNINVESYDIYNYAVSKKFFVEAKSPSPGEVFADDEDNAKNQEMAARQKMFEKTK